MSFASYKKSRTTDLTNLNKKVDEIAEGSKKFSKDSRFWRPTVDKDGSGSAKLRFLPASEGEDLPWVQFYEHNFDVDGTYFVEYCPTSLGRDCPVCKANGILWKSGAEKSPERDLVSKRKRQQRYIVNILVTKDKAAAENEGKIFLYQFGPKIFEKIKMALKPKDDDDPAVNVFDFWDGADFSLDIAKVKGYRNYDESKFRVPSALLGGDDKELENIYKQLYPLQPFVVETKFKTYEELEKKLNDVLSGVKGKIQKKADELFDTKIPETTPEKKVERKPKPEDESTPPWTEEAKSTRKPKATKTKAAAKAAAKADPKDEDVPVGSDDALNYYDKMANEE
jgi:hypothetical protein